MFHNSLCVNALRFAFQKAVFRLAKGHVLKPQRRPFTARKTMFCKASSKCLHKANCMSKRKYEFICNWIFHFSFFTLHLNLPMHLVSFDVNRAERTRRTQVFARSATYAACLVDGRYFQRMLVVGVERHHCDCPSGTMACAVAALHAVCQRHAVLLNPHRMAYLHSRLLRPCDRFDCSRRTNLAALGALRAAISALVRHRWLHER